jgi:hypothetical protein
MVTVLGLLIAPVLSVTVRLNVRDVAAVGAMNVGEAVFAPVRSQELLWVIVSIGSLQ